MNRQRRCSIAMGLILALAGTGPALAAEAGRDAQIQAPRAQQQAPAGAARYSLSMEQMDAVHGGRINLCEPDSCVRPPPPDPGHGAGCTQCPVIWNSGVDGPIIIWDRSGR